MNEEVLETRAQILEEIFGNTIYNRANDEVTIFCPQHSHHTRKLCVNVRKNMFHCWVCEYASKKIFKLLWEHANRSQRDRYLNTLDIKLEYIETPLEKVELPEEYKFDIGFSSPCGAMAEAYLYNKLNLSREFIIQNKIGYCDDGFYKNRVLFPSFDLNGDLNYFLTRRVDGGYYKKYLDCSCSKSKIVFNELFIDWSKPVVLVESVNAYLKHFQVPNIVPLLGSYLKEDYKVFESIVINDCPKVFIALDKEAKNKSLNIIKKFLSYQIDTLMVPVKNQIDNVSTSEFVDLLLQAQPFSKNDILKEKIKNL